MPSKRRVGLQLQILLQVHERIAAMLAATPHLLLAILQIVQHSSVSIELCKDGERLDKHTNCTTQRFVLSSVVDGGKERFLLIVVLCQQVGISCGE